MTIGLKLRETGYRFESDERVRVYLTNALEPAQETSAKRTFVIPALAHEGEAVYAVKRVQRFTVVIGNPPYAKLSANRDEAAEELVAPFKEPVRSERNVQPLSDDYLKFLGLALGLSDQVLAFVFGMVTNRGHLVGLIHRGVREVLFERWKQLWVADLHGDSNVREINPEGGANENVFDIKQGVAITLAAKSPGASACSQHIDVWGTQDEKYAQLNALKAPGTAWTHSVPSPPHFFFEMSSCDEAGGIVLVPLNKVMPVTNTGLKTHRDALVIDFDPKVLEERIRRFRDPARSDDVVRLEFFGTSGRGPYLPGDNRDWSMVEARSRLQADEKSLRQRIRAIEYRPFDRRSIFYSADLIDRIRDDLMRHMDGGDNLAIVATRQVPNGLFCHASVTRLPIEMKTGSYDRGTNLFPLWLKADESMLKFASKRRHNFSSGYLKALGRGLDLPAEGKDGLPSGLSSEEIFWQIYTILHSPSYRLRFAGQLRVGFPPIPIPSSFEFFQELSGLGRELGFRHLLESPKHEESPVDFVCTGAPQVEKVSYSDETVWIDKAKTRGFKDVSEEVWNFHIGGYQVCNKWLKDRQAKTGKKNPRPGRKLTKKDIDHYQEIVVAISETIRLMAEIDKVIDKHGGWPDAFVTDDKTAKA